MASSQLMFLCVLLSLFNFNNSTLSSSYKKVKVDFYLEPMCSDCSQINAYNLVKLFDNGLIKIMDLNLVPYGNCQHGPSECDLNTIHKCAIYAWPYVKTDFDLCCIEDPPLELLPWVVLNGIPLREKSAEWMMYVCQAYEGIPPKACVPAEAQPGSRITHNEDKDDDNNTKWWKVLLVIFSVLAGIIGVQKVTIVVIGKKTDVTVISPQDIELSTVIDAQN